jgi:hypothetical protein
VSYKVVQLKVDIIPSYYIKSHFVWISYVIQKSASVMLFMQAKTITFLLYGNNRPTRCKRWFFIAKLIFRSTCFGHHYAHHQEFKSIIQVVAAVVLGALVYRLSVWCGAVGYVSGLRDAAVTYSSTTDRQPVNQSTKYHRQQRPV